MAAPGPSETSIPLEPLQQPRSYQARVSSDGLEDEKSSFPPLEQHNTLHPHDAMSRDDITSPNGLRAEASRLNDDLELLRAERVISSQQADIRRSRSRRRSTSASDAFDDDHLGAPDSDDAFNQTTFKDAVKSKKRESNACLYKFWLYLKKFPRIFRYILYMIPGAGLLLIPVLLGALAIDEEANPVGGNGGVYLMWFGIWLMIVWCSLWVSRMITSLMPHIFFGIAKVAGSTNAKKWKDIGWQLELHTALFLWFLAILVSFKPTMNGHRVPYDGDEDNTKWIDITNKVIIALFVMATLNFLEKICIQWIAASFHMRTYATRIENNKSDIRQLVALYEHAKSYLEHTDSFWQGSSSGTATGAQTPMRQLGDNARQVWDTVGYVAGKVGNDFIGRKSANKNHPRKVVTELLRSTPSAHTLARLIYRSLVPEGKEMVLLEDMQKAFQTEEETEAAFNVFDKDLNGDISMDEFEMVCNEIHLEKKAIAASLKDLDSVVQKLDGVFLFIIVVISIIVFISILSGSAAAGLASAGTAVLGLAWMLQATAQEFLQSIIFVFVKHPFDVGDRVTIYGSTGANMTGDDYYVTEISLLYTEFKKMEGHIVQAPNSLLNTLFILNQRRSNGLADVVPLTMRFGTPQWMIEELKSRMREFALDNKRDYQKLILTEMVKMDEVRSCTMNFIFFHKTNFQNELVRLTRHNRFVTELMHQMVLIGIQSPYRVEPGGSRDNPMYWAGLQHPPAYGQDVTDYANSAPPPTRTGSTMGRRGSVLARAASVPTIAEEPGTGFQDVFENRRDRSNAHRLASIKEKNRGAQLEEEAEPRGSTSALAPTRSHDSRSRILGRARTMSRTMRRQTEQTHHGGGGEIV
ncbi:mechanosensitive ion channel domain-containing protein [Sarocladium implicatum]|nr:mechanosensitive ion channel domain-containing protein [Sarocladium implicatum]